VLDGGKSDQRIIGRICEPGQSWRPDAPASGVCPPARHQGRSVPGGQICDLSAGSTPAWK
jgi:hypothetical protein